MFIAIPFAWHTLSFSAAGTYHFSHLLQRLGKVNISHIICRLLSAALSSLLGNRHSALRAEHIIVFYLRRGAIPQNLPYIYISTISQASKCLIIKYDCIRFPTPHQA
jgi:hypothetical protein